jgi:P4 family phage/plasmid primase-like protien
MNNSPYYLSSSKALPHIFIKSNTEMKNKRPAIIDKYKGVEILSGQWSYAPKNGIINNANVPIQTLDLSFMLPKQKIKPKRIALTVCDTSLLNEFMSCINVSRADEYGTWLDIGFALFNVSENNLSIWETFSKKSKKYKSGECEKIWCDMRKTNMSIGTIKYYAKIDNPTLYEEIKTRSVESKIDMAIRSHGAHIDVANVVYQFFEGEYVYCGDWWYFNYTYNKWMTMTKGNILCKELMQICAQFMNRSRYWHTQSCSMDCEDDTREKSSEYAKIANRIALKLKDMPYCKNILSACEMLFADETNQFVNSLDSHSHLLAFTNGVYDFKLMEFRDTQPSDMISITTGYDYIEDYYEDVICELNKLLTSVFPNHKVKQYYLNIMSRALNGSLSKEEFYIHTGKGGNGKGILDTLMSLVFGFYYLALNASMFCLAKSARSGAEPEVAQMKGKRLVVGSEAPENSSFQMGTIKAWTGGDIINARELYKEPINFKPQFALHFQCNDMPNIANIDDSITRRVRAIKYTISFKEDPKEENERPINVHLKGILTDDIKYRQCMMRMLILNYIDIKDTKIIIPDECIKDTNKYLASNDVIKNWFKVNVEVNAEVDTKTKLKASTLYDNYKNWMIKNSYSKQIIKSAQFHDTILNKFGHIQEKSSGMVYKTLKLKDQNIDDED